MSDYLLIVTSAYPLIREVRLYKETLAHVSQQHPEVPVELPALAMAVERAIQNPTHIEQSYATSYVFVDADTTNQSGDPLRIPVKIIDGASGRVRTAYFATSRVGQNRIVWRRRDV